MADPEWYTEFVRSGVGAYKLPSGGDDDVAGYIRSAASARGIDPEVAIKVAQSEGGLVPNRTGSFATGRSFWPFQLHYGGPGYESFGNVAGMGNAFTQKTGYQPGDPAAWRAATDYALDAARRQGWGAWYGARNVGITGYQGIDRTDRTTRPQTGAGSAPAASLPDRSVSADDPAWYREFAPQRAPVAPEGPVQRSEGDEGDPAWYRQYLASGGTPGAADASRGGEDRGTVWPVAGERPGAVTNPFGARQSRAAGASIPLPASNVGADLRARYGAAVVAPVSGVVVEAFDAPNEEDRNLNHGWGGMVLIRGEDGYTHRLSHQQPGLLVRPGQRVTAGQPVGRVGLSGNTTGAHLDWEKFDTPGHFVDPTGSNPRSSSPSGGAAILTVEPGDPAWFKAFVGGSR